MYDSHFYCKQQLQGKILLEIQIYGKNMNTLLAHERI